MDNEDQAQYEALCEGVATYILLGSLVRANEALAQAEHSGLNVTTVWQDVDRIVQAARKRSYTPWEGVLPLPR